MGLERLPDEVDIAVIGGGINGASIYSVLAAAGYRVLLVDRGDFAGGTSQASTMMIWGGLLYLKDWEVATVARLSASRDRLIATRPSEIRVRPIRYIPEPGGRSRAFVQAVLYAYWLLGAARRRRPRFDRDFEERTLLKPGLARGALTYEEASLETSDARFVLSWILNTDREGCLARNYCALEAARYDAARGAWRLDLADSRQGAVHVRARLVINAAGGWTDAINQRNGLDSPYRHLLSRGVSMAVPRARWHHHHLAFDNGVGGNAMALVPWGPVSLWGSTDSMHPDMERAREIDARDVTYLFAQLNRHLASPAGPADVVSLRCGVRAVAVARNTRVDQYSPSLSRRHRVHVDPSRPWVSVYGGKLSGCTALARSVAARVAGRIGRGRVTAPAPPSPQPHPTPQLAAFPGLDAPVVSPAWAAAREQCRTIEDYLRRRTNIAQWVRRGGFGAQLEHLEALRAIARTLHDDDAEAAEQDLARYRASVDRQWSVLQGVTL